MTLLRDCAIVTTRSSRTLQYNNMGFTLPSPESPVEQTRALMAQKSNIEAELESHISILKANNVTMQSPLVDVEGFPRADIDIYAVRGARVRIIELRNDLKAVVDAIGKALEGIYDPALQQSSQNDSSSERPLKPFAKVDGVAPGSPAAEAVRIYPMYIFYMYTLKYTFRPCKEGISS